MFSAAFYIFRMGEIILKDKIVQSGPRNINMNIKTENFQSNDPGCSFYKEYYPTGLIASHSTPLPFCSSFKRFEYDDLGRVVTEFQEGEGIMGNYCEYYQLKYEYFDYSRRVYFFLTGFIKDEDINSQDSEGNRIDPPVYEANELIKIEEEFFNEDNLIIRQKIVDLKSGDITENQYHYDISGRKVSEITLKNKEKIHDDSWTYEEKGEISQVINGSLVQGYQNKLLVFAHNEDFVTYKFYDSDKKLKSFQRFKKKDGEEKLETEIKISRGSGGIVIHCLEKSVNISLGELIQLPHEKYNYDLQYYWTDENPIKIEIKTQGPLIKSIKIQDMASGRVRGQKYFVNYTFYESKQLLTKQIVGVEIENDQIWDLFTWDFTYYEEGEN